MKTYFPQNWQIHNPWLRYFIITVLLLGIFFRLFNLDGKIYWHDETYTSLRISGYTRIEMMEKTYNGNIITPEDIQKFQRPNAEKNILGTITGLAKEEPQHPPLYFILSRWWVELFGSSVATIRSLPAIISLFSFPGIFWLCLELFNSSLVGWVAMAMIAVSPYNIVYAQEARQYSLWAVTILIATTMLLRALRLNNKFSWGMYAISLAFLLNTFLLSIFVCISHGIYVLITQGFRISKKVSNYLLTSFLGMLTFTPWLIVVLLNYQKTVETTYWAQRDIPLLKLAQKLLLHISWVFFDVLYGYHNINDVLYNPYEVKLNLTNPFTYFIPVIMIIIGYSIYFLYRKTTMETWLLLILLIAIPFGVLLIPDLILGGQRSTATRYLVPAYLSMEIIIAYLLANQITTKYSKTWQQKLWQLIFVGLLSVGVISGVVISQTPTWSNKDTYFTLKLAQEINQTSKPLIISDTKTTGGIVSLNYLLDGKVRWQLIQPPHNFTIPEGFSDIFIYRTPSPETAKSLTAQNYQIQVLEEFGSHLWGGFKVAKLVKVNK